MCFSVLVKKTFENSFGEQFKDSFKWLFYSLSDFDRQVNMCSPMLRRLRPSKYPWLSMQWIKYMNFIHNTFCGTHIWNYPHCLYFCLMVEVNQRRPEGLCSCNLRPLLLSVWCSNSQAHNQESHKHCGSMVCIARHESRKQLLSKETQQLCKITSRKGYM